MNDTEIAALDEAVKITPIEHTTVSDYFVEVMRNYIKIRKRNKKPQDD